MAISDENWVEIEKHLKGFFGCCVFALDGVEINVSRRPYDEGRMWLAVHLDGSFNLSWGWPDHDNFRPIVKQLWKRRFSRLYSPQERKKLAKQFGVRRAREIFTGLDKEREWWEPLFPKAAPLVRQLRKIEGLELVHIGLSQGSLNVN